MNMQQDKRKIRIQRVKEMIRKKESVGHDEILALIDVEFGVRENTANSYLRTLHRLKFIEYDSQAKTWSIKK